MYYSDESNDMPRIKDIIKDFIESDKKDVHVFLKDILQELGHDIKDSIMDTLRSFGKKPVLNCLMYLVIGRDASNGEMKWEDDSLVIHWDPQDSMPLFDNMKRILTQISEKGLGGSFQPNPLWPLFQLLVTVHPLGGCKMGKDEQHGVVDHKGEVFSYPNLYIEDGSIFPKALGVNPSLTIAAIAERNAALMLQ